MVMMMMMMMMRILGGGPHQLQHWILADHDAMALPAAVYMEMRCLYHLVNWRWHWICLIVCCFFWMKKHYIYIYSGRNCQIVCMIKLLPPADTEEKTSRTSLAPETSWLVVHPSSRGTISVVNEPWKDPPTLSWKKPFIGGMNQSYIIIR